MPTLRDGYAYLLRGRHDWKTAPHSDWEVTMQSEDQLTRAKPSHLGTRQIDGVTCDVFMTTRGRVKYLAQTKLGGE